MKDLIRCIESIIFKGAAVYWLCYRWSTTMLLLVICHFHHHLLQIIKRHQTPSLTVIHMSLLSMPRSHIWDPIMWRRKDSHQRKRHEVSHSKHHEVSQLSKVGHFSSHSKYGICVTSLGGHYWQKYRERQCFMVSNPKVWSCEAETSFCFIWKCHREVSNSRLLCSMWMRSYYVWPFILCSTVIATQYSCYIHLNFTLSKKWRHW